MLHIRLPFLQPFAWFSLGYWLYDLVCLFVLVTLEQMKEDDLCRSEGPTPGPGGEGKVRPDAGPPLGPVGPSPVVPGKEEGEMGRGEGSPCVPWVHKREIGSGEGTPVPGEGSPPGPGECTPPGPGEGTPPGPGEGPPSVPGEGTTPVPGEGTPPIPGKGTPLGPGEGTPLGPGEGTPPGPEEGTPPSTGEGTLHGPGEWTPPGPGGEKKEVRLPEGPVEVKRRGAFAFLLLKHVVNFVRWWPGIVFHHLAIATFLVMGILATNRVRGDSIVGYSLLMELSSIFVALR
jgi:hypothetical protein